MATTGLFRLPVSCRSALLRTACNRPLVSFLLHQSYSRISTTFVLTGAQPQSPLVTVSRRYFHPSLANSNSVLVGNREANTTPDSDSLLLDKYEPPKTGLLSVLPASWVPYAELVRLDKPTGTYYLYFPCLFSTLLAAPASGSPWPLPLSVLGTSLLFFSGALIMRGAGCTINDLWDRNLDPHVSTNETTTYCPWSDHSLQCSRIHRGTAVHWPRYFLQFPYQCLFYGIPSFLLVATYPWPRESHTIPSLSSGLLSRGVPSWDFPPLVSICYRTVRLSQPQHFSTHQTLPGLCLYDMIYAHMDIKDDSKAGIKSIALKHDQQTKQILSGLAVTQIGLLAAAGMAVGAGPVFFVGSCGGAAVTLAVMIKKVNLKSVKDCWWWFVNGCWMTGGVISAGTWS
jgi:4-hydroxybenzoate polyprenyltransferase